MKKESIREKNINAEVQPINDIQKTDKGQNTPFSEEAEAVWEDINRKHIYLLSRVATNKFQTK